jgi:hypothetical protein
LPFATLPVVGLWIGPIAKVGSSPPFGTGAKIEACTPRFFSNDILTDANGYNNGLRKEM